MVDEKTLDTLPAGASKKHVARLQEWKEHPEKLQEWLRQTMLLHLQQDAELGQGDTKEAADARKRFQQTAAKLLMSEDGDE